MMHTIMSSMPFFHCISFCFMSTLLSSALLSYLFCLLYSHLSSFYQYAFQKGSFFTGCSPRAIIKLYSHLLFSHIFSVYSKLISHLSTNMLFRMAASFQVVLHGYFSNWPLLRGASLRIQWSQSEKVAILKSILGQSEKSDPSKHC